MLYESRLISLYLRVCQDGQLRRVFHRPKRWTACSDLGFRLLSPSKLSVVLKRPAHKQGVCVWGPAFRFYPQFNN